MSLGVITDFQSVSWKQQIVRISNCLSSCHEEKRRTCSVSGKNWRIVAKCFSKKTEELKSSTFQLLRSWLPHPTISSSLKRHTDTHTANCRLGAPKGSCLLLQRPVPVLWCWSFTLSRKKWSNLLCYTVTRSWFIQSFDVHCISIRHHISMRWITLSLFCLDAPLIVRKLLSETISICFCVSPQGKCEIYSFYLTVELITVATHVCLQKHKF